MTRALHVREAVEDDFPAIAAIAAVNGMEGYQWPRDAWGSVAVLDDRTVAFCAGRDINGGLLVEDLWAVPGSDGVRGLAALAEWVEEAAARTAREIGKPVKVGGIVFPSNERHQAALERRGYTHYANIYSKEVNG